MATTLTRKGRVTVPKAIREYLGITPGSAVTFEQLVTGEIVLRAAKAYQKRRGSFFARLRGRATVKMKTEEIMALTRRT